MMAIPMSLANAVCMAERSFVLLPLAEIAPTRIHPQSLKTMKQLLEDLLSK